MFQGDPKPKRIDGGHKKKKCKVNHVQTPTLTDEVHINFVATLNDCIPAGYCSRFKTSRGGPILAGLHGRHGPEPDLMQVLPSVK